MKCDYVHSYEYAGEAKICRCSLEFTDFETAVGREIVYEQPYVENECPESRDQLSALECIILTKRNKDIEVIPEAKKKKLPLVREG